MPDVNFSNPASNPDSRAAEARAAAARDGDLRWDIIELLFFAYRDFVGDADHELEAFGFGRAHHRVLHFVYRYPGLKVADLLGSSRCRVSVAIQPGPVRCERLAGCDRDVARRAGWIFTENH